MFLSVATDEEFVRLCRVLGRADLVTDSRFAMHRERMEHDAELAEILAAVFLTCPAAAWEARLGEARVGCMAADVMSQFAFFYKDPQARAVEAMVETEHPTFGGGTGGTHQR